MKSAVESAFEALKVAIESEHARELRMAVEEAIDGAIPADGTPRRRSASRLDQAYQMTITRKTEVPTAGVGWTPEARARQADRISASWTPERRAKMAAHARRRLKLARKLGKRGFSGV